MDRLKSSEATQTGSRSKSRYGSSEERRVSIGRLNARKSLLTSLGPGKLFGSAEGQEVSIERLKRRE